ncbi:MAG: DUF2786 domain-containing protein [Ignavibacteriales bacterium]|nr:DUF2786 domain-containing protein [Ignavibacteriales bacterium]
MNEQHENSVIEKIKKLLRIKRGGTTAEIETALALAQKLAAKNNIDINSINENDERVKEPITHLSTDSLARLQMECRYSALIANRFFNVRTFVLRGVSHRIIFVGTKNDLEIARYVYNFLVRHFRNEWNNNRGKLRNRQSFMLGMYQGLFVKLIASEPVQEKKEGIIHTGHRLELTKYIDENFGELNSSKIKPEKHARTAQLRGYVAGKNTNIRKGIKTNNNALLLLPTTDERI